MKAPKHIARELKMEALDEMLKRSAGNFIALSMLPAITDRMEEAAERAIRLDRAQREQVDLFGTLDEMLGSWENYDGEVDTFLMEWSDKIKRTLNGE